MYWASKEEMRKKCEEIELMDLRIEKVNKDGWGLGALYTALKEISMRYVEGLITENRRILIRAISGNVGISVGYVHNIVHTLGLKTKNTYK